MNLYDSRAKLEGNPISQADPPFRGELTIIWQEEKAELLRRLDTIESKLMILEAWASSVQAMPLDALLKRSVSDQVSTP